MPFSYEVPFLDFTITQESSIEYAKTHISNAGPVLSIIVLVILGIVMTLIWAYLILCACCCGSRRKSSANNDISSSPRMGVSGPLSPSRSNAPLHRGPNSSPTPPTGGGGGAGVAKSPIPEDEPISPTYYGVSAFDAVDQRFKSVRRMQSLEKNRKKFSFRCFYVTTGLFVLLLTICAGAIYMYQTKFDVALKKLATDIEGVMLGSADFLCTSEEDSTDCVDESLGDFVIKAEDKTTGILTGIVDWLNTVGGILTPVNATIDTLENAKIVLSSIIDYADQINSNISVINQYKNWLLNPDVAQTTLSSSFPSSNLPNVTDDQLQTVNEGVASIDTAITNANGVYSNVKSAVDSGVNDAISQLDPVTGTTTAEIMNPLNKIFDSLIDYQNKALDYYEVTDANKDAYNGYLTKKTQGLTLLFFFPVILTVILTMINLSCKKCSCHLVLNMCISYLCLIFFCLFALVFSLMATVTNTVCEYHLVALDKVLKPTNFTVSDVTVQVSPQLVREILTCPGGTNATSNNNFIDILGVESLFNVTEQVNKATSQVTSATADFDPDADIQDALDQLAAMSNSTTFNISATSPISSYKSSLTSLFHRLPSIDMDRTDGHEREKLRTSYLSSAPVNFWDTYQGNLDIVNSILAGVQPSVPPTFLSSYDLNTAWNFTYDAVAADLSDWQALTYTHGNLTDLRGNLTVLDAYTTAVNTAVSANNVVVTNLTIVAEVVDKVQVCVDKIDGVQTSVSSLQGDIVNNLNSVLTTADGILDGVDTQANNIKTIGPFISSAPEYTKCGFVGEFYNDGFLGGFCGNFKGSLYMMWPFMIAAAFCIFALFLTFSCYVRKPLSFLEPEDEDEMAATTNVLTPGSARAVVVLA